MKKRISFIIALMMLLNIFCGAVSVSADVIQTGYEFADTAYGNGVYIALAKDYNKNANGNPTPVIAYRSEDGVQWERVFSSSSAYNSLNKTNAQSLEWWEDAGVFALYTGDNLYFSADGSANTWMPTKKDGDNQGWLRGNGVIATNGNILAVAGGRAMKIAQPDAVFEQTTQSHHCFSEKDIYTEAVSVTNENEAGNKTFLTVANGNYYLFSGEYGDGANADFTDVKSLSTGLGSQKVKDILYDSRSMTWYIINGSGNIYSLLSNNDNTYTSFKAAGDEDVTAIEKNSSMFVIGKDDGSIYFTITDSGINEASKWNKAEVKFGTLDEEIKSISAIGEDRFLIVSKSKIYIGIVEGEELGIYEAEHSTAEEQNAIERIEIPALGAEYTDFTFTMYDMDGEAVVDTLQLKESYRGVALNGSSLEVSAEAEAGDVVIEVISTRGLRNEYTVSLIQEESILLNGYDGISILSGKENFVQYTAAVIGNDGEAMNRTATITAEGLYDGVEFDPGTNTVTVQPDAAEGEIILKAVSDTKANITAQRRVVIKKSGPALIKLKSGETELTTDGSLGKYTYSAVVTDVQDIELDNKIKWSVSSDNPKIMLDESGILRFYGIKNNMTLSLRAECVGHEDVYIEISVNIFYSNSDGGKSNVVASDGYEFIDMAYSKTLDTYIAVAKNNFVAAEQSKSEIYCSDNFVDWEKVFSADDTTNKSNVASRQVIVWWESADVFVAALGSKIYISSDGRNWKKSDKLSCTSYPNVSTNGKKLLIGGKTSLYTADSLDGELEQVTFSDGKYESAASAMDNEDLPRFVNASGYVTWPVTAEGKASQSYQTIGTPLDMQYSAVLDRWVVITPASAVRVLKFPNSYTAFNLMTDNGMRNEEILTALCVGSNAIFTGTAGGKIFVNDSGDSELSAGTVWNRVYSGSTTEDITSSIKSIIQVDENTYAALSADSVYMILKYDNIWKLYNMTKNAVDIPDSKTRIEVPASGASKIVFEPIPLDFKGEPIDDKVWGFYPVSDIPDGVSFDFRADDEGISEITVDSSVKGGSELKMQLKCESGITANIVLSFVTESYVRILVKDKMSLSKAKSGEWEVNAPVFGNDDRPMERNSVIELTSAPSGVSFNKAEGKITISDNAQEGEIVLNAYAVNDEQMTDKKTLLLERDYSQETNLFENGDVELGDTTGFESTDEMTVVREDVHIGAYSLKLNGDNVQIPYTKIDKDNAYLYEAYVKADSGKVITINSDKFGNMNSVTANGSYTRIRGMGYTSITDESVITVSVNGAEGFLIDDVCFRNISREYDEVTRALSTAKYTKKKADVDNARKLVESFYDVPQKQQMLDELNKIVISDTDTPSKPSSSSGGGGGGASNKYVPITADTANQADNEEKVSDYNLIFKDLKGHWAKDDIEAMAVKGIVSGREEGVFDPEAPITRAEFAVLAAKTIGLPETNYENVFFDIISDDWYSGYVQAARNANLIAGSDGLYRPNDNISREEITKIIVSAYSEKTGTPIETGGALYYSDLSDISVWAYDYIVNAVNLEFVKGVSEYLFAPKATATRAQAAVMLKRLLDKLPQ